MRAKLENVTKADVRAFRDAIRAGWTEESGNAIGNCGKAGKAPVHHRTAKTANDCAVDVAGMFRSTMREGMLLASPCAALERLPEDDSTEREVFTMAEVGKLVSTAGDATWQDAVFPAGQIRALVHHDWWPTNAKELSKPSFNRSISPVHEIP